MINLRQYVAGIKPKDKEHLVLTTGATDVCPENKIVLLVPSSEFTAIITELENESFQYR